jgi:hypothetical protein
MTGNEQQSSPTKQVILDYKKNELTPKLNAAQAESRAAQTKTKSSESNRQYKICAYVKGQEVLNFYNTLDFCEAISAVATSGQIGDKIKKLDAKSGELKKQFDDVVKFIKDLRAKLAEVETKTYDVGDAFEDPSNRDQIVALGGMITIGDMNALVDMADKAHDQSNFAFSTAVDVAGILTFANTESLKGFGDALSQKTADFKKNIDENVKKTTEDVKKSQQELSDASKALMVNKLTAMDPSVECTGLNKTSAFLGEGDNTACDCLDPATIKEVCEALEKIYDEPESSSTRAVKSAPKKEAARRTSPSQMK